MVAVLCELRAWLRALRVQSFFCRTTQVALLATACVLFLGAGEQQARFDKLGHKLMCRCGCNQILLECNHVGCAYSDKMRAELMAGVASPDSDDLVLQRFVQAYGAVVLAAPTTTGFNRLAWVTPFVALLAGVLTVVYVVRRWKLRTPATPVAATSARASLELDSFRERARKETEL
ncbi:MAG TPA: cytochrome c-type biogenesis protein CcmH [Terriglobales bacterium]|jgi:cytochrome c-type biogenesis protein CcmH|nr:cytochrome c-type biogenesis protein CcmH [Terriglobales bacterium]